VTAEVVAQACAILGDCIRELGDVVDGAAAVAAAPTSV
jgi:hypothetical protein